MQTICKICKETKNDILFKQQNSKRVGLVCIKCDLLKKRELYKNNENERNRAKANAKKWRVNNLDRAKQLSKNYRTIHNTELKHKKKIYHQNNADIINAKTRKWYKENKEHHNKNSKIYQELNKEKLKILHSEYYQENKEYFSKLQKEWRKQNPHMTTAYVRQYNLAKINRTPSWANVKEIQNFYRNCPDKFEVDHIHPLQGKLISGLHIIENLQYLTISENKSKHRKFEPYWVFYEPSGIRIEVI